ncbi:MAG TPA: IS110 family transposase [Chryseosolibacter sp.]|nr:IS110 family transposase [Chryseosolibacter sp.]
MRTKVNHNLFEGQSIYVGIDCHKSSWKVSIQSERYEHKTMSQDPSPETLASYLKRNFPGASYKAVYEAGFSGFDACRVLNKLGIDCIVAHAADVPTSEKERLQKTDKADCRKLARSLRNGELTAIHIPDRYLEADRALIRQRQRISKDVSRIKNRIKSLLLQFSIQMPAHISESQSRYWSKAYLTWLKGLTFEEARLKQVIDNYVRQGEFLRKDLLTVNRQIKELSESEFYGENFKLLRTVPGIGLIAGMTFLVEIGDTTRFNKLDELCNYIGLVPKMHSSGDRTFTGKMMNRGKKILKIMLIEASWIAVRHDPALMAKFNEMSLVMQKNKAIIRIARKLLSRMRYVLEHNLPYETGIVK